MYEEDFPARRHVVVKFIATVIVALIFSQSARAQGFGSFGALFLTLSPSAVANGMGSGSVAASTDASAIYYNPAALARLGRATIEGNTFKLLPELIDDARYSHLAGVYQFNSLNGLWLGVAYTRLGLGEQTYTGEDSPEPIGVFEPNDWALSLAAATRLGQQTRFGLGIKYIRSNFFYKQEESASSFAIDLGFLYDGFLPAVHYSRQFLKEPLPWSKWAAKGLPPGFSLGVALVNIGPKIEYIEETQADPLPQNLRIGLVWNIIDSDVIGIAATGEFLKYLVKINEDGTTDGPLEALFTAWTDQSLHDEFSEATYEGGFEVSFLRVGAIRFGRHWDGDLHFGYNTFGYSLGPPALRFSFAKTSRDDDFSFGNWRIYSVSVGLDQLF